MMTYDDMVDRFPVGCEVANRNPPDSLDVPESMQVTGYTDPAAYGRPMMILRVKWAGWDPYDIPCEPEGYARLPEHSALGLRLDTVRLSRLLSQALPYLPDDLADVAGKAILETSRRHDFDAPALEGVPDNAHIVNF